MTPDENTSRETSTSNSTIVIGDQETTTTSPDKLQNTALSRERVEQFLYEMRNQPAWRREADKACDYYDGNQLTADTVERLRERGQPPLITNLIKPTIDTVLDMEAKSRTDWLVRPEDDRIAKKEVVSAPANPDHQACFFRKTKWPITPKIAQNSMAATKLTTPSFG